MTKRKKLSIAICVLVLALVSQLACSPTFAKTPVDIDIIELVDDGNGGYKSWTDITGAMPGMTYSAIPRVKNNGTMPVSIKMCLLESVTSASGESMPLPARTFDIKIEDGWSLDNESTDNQTSSALRDCYRYNSTVEVGDMTKPLFTKITLNRGLGNEYQDSTFTLHLEAIAVNDEAVAPTDSDIDSEKPSSPDTGINTASYFEIVSPVAFSAGAIVLFATIAYLLRKI
jgi:hypothetical protein